MNTMLVQVEVRRVYGVEQVYPVNATARGLAELAGTRTLTAAALRSIRALGYTVEQVAVQSATVGGAK